MTSVKSMDIETQSCVYENSLPKGCQVMELSHIDVYESLHCEDTTGDISEEQYDSVCTDKSVHASSFKGFDREEDSTRRRNDAVDAAADDEEEHYDVVIAGTSVNNSSTKDIDLKVDSNQPETTLKTKAAPTGRMGIMIAIIGVVLVFIVIGAIIAGVIMYHTINAKIEELERERRAHQAQDEVWKEQIVSYWRGNYSDGFDAAQDTNNRLESLESLVQELNNRSGTNMDSVQLEINASKAEFSHFQDVVGEQIVSLIANDSNTLDDIQETNERLDALGNLVATLNESGMHSAFSVWNPNTITSGRLRFLNTIYNFGGDYNISTGIFTCSKPGVYYFSVSLTKKRADTRVDWVYCNLYKNGGHIIYIKVDPTDDATDNGHASVSNSVLLELNRNDTVSLRYCSNPSTHMESWSSFTGFLLYPET